MFLVSMGIHQGLSLEAILNSLLPFLPATDMQANQQSHEYSTRFPPQTQEEPPSPSPPPPAWPLAQATKRRRSSGSPRRAARSSAPPSSSSRSRSAPSVRRCVCWRFLFLGRSFSELLSLGGGGALVDVVLLPLCFFGKPQGVANHTPVLVCSCCLTTQNAFQLDEARLHHL